MTNYNQAEPWIMYIDLNSCFATIEQQARPLLRGKPVAIVNRKTENTSIITASYEAKARGVTVGMKFKDAKKLIPSLVGLESDPPKYRYVYHKLLNIMNDYSAHVTMKSIDEGVIDFHQSPVAIQRRGLVAIGQEIKQRLRDEIGCAMRCNVGISTNRFLAKTAAGLHKPDGMDSIVADNLEATFQTLRLTDLTGIASCNQARLNRVGIFSPLDFLHADEVTLEKIVFKGVTGRQWYQRLRGFEVDDVSTTVKRVGRQYVMERYGLNHEQAEQRLHHLCESVGERLRGLGKQARGVFVYAKTYEHNYWHTCCVSPQPFFSNRALYERARKLFETAPGLVKEIGIHCYLLEDLDADSQLQLFTKQFVHERQLSQAMDTVNRQWGERTLVAADTIDTSIYVKQKIPFGSTRYL